MAANNKTYYTMTFEQYERIMFEVQGSTVHDVWIGAMAEYSKKPEDVTVALSTYEAQVTSARSLTFRAIKKKSVANSARTSTIGFPPGAEAKAVAEAERIIRDHALRGDT